MGSVIDLTNEDEEQCPEQDIGFVSPWSTQFCLSTFVSSTLGDQESEPLPTVSPQKRHKSKFREEEEENGAERTQAETQANDIIEENEITETREVKESSQRSQKTKKKTIKRRKKSGKETTEERIRRILGLVESDHESETELRSTQNSIHSVEVRARTEPTVSTRLQEICGAEEEEEEEEPAQHSKKAAQTTTQDEEQLTQVASGEEGDELPTSQINSTNPLKQKNSRNHLEEITIVFDTKWTVDDRKKDQLTEFFSSKNCNVEVREQKIKHAVTWERRVQPKKRRKKENSEKIKRRKRKKKGAAEAEVEDEQENESEKVRDQVTEEETVVLWVSLSKFLALLQQKSATNSSSEEDHQLTCGVPTSSSIASSVASLSQFFDNAEKHFPQKKLILLLEGKSEGVFKRPEHRRALLDAIAWLQLCRRVNVRQCTYYSDSLSYLWRVSQIIARIPYIKNEEVFEHFCASVYKKVSNTPEETWTNQLLQIYSVSYQVAKAIVGKHPSPRSLIGAYRREDLTREQKELLLADLQVNEMGRKVGQAISRKIYSIYTSLDGDMLIY